MKKDMQCLSELIGTILEISMSCGNENCAYNFNSSTYQAVAFTFIVHTYGTWPVARCM